MTNISITPGKNNVGAYINDINLKSLDQDQAMEIKKILNQYGVIFIKEQNLDPETYQNLMSFRELLFSLFHGGDQRKKSENPKKCQMSGIHI